MRILHTLSFKIFAGTLSILLVLFGVYSYLTIRFHTEQMMQQVSMSAYRVSDIIKNSTHYSMLQNRKQDVYQTIDVIGKEEGVEGIRIYNKRGEITFSTMPEEKGRMVDLHAEACVVCHDSEKPLESLPMNNRMRIYSGKNGTRIVGLINPIRNEPSCSQSGCHSEHAERTVLGVLDVRMSLQQVDKAITQSSNTMILYAIIMVVVVALASAMFLFFAVRTPVKKLIEGTQQISSGNLSHTLAIESKDELGRLAQSFNVMTQSLQKAGEENKQWAQTLEDRVQKKTDELKKINEQIIQLEKIASLGKLAATVAHEINNPLEAILTYAKLNTRRLKKNFPDDSQRAIIEDMELITRETDRCGNIVKNLLLFSRKKIGEFQSVRIDSIISKVSQLMDHHLSMSNITLTTSVSPKELTLLCDEQQIHQALVALCVNAVEAMSDGGTIHIAAAQTHSDDPIIISVNDSGIGIAQEDIEHIFEPFFTTKSNESGVGLGLSVVYGIMERHGGKISVQSTMGKGTTFTLSFPPLQK